MSRAKRLLSLTLERVFNLVLKDKIDKNSAVYNLAGIELKLVYTPDSERGFNYALYKKDGKDWVEYKKYPGMGDIRKDIPNIMKELGK